ncbi:BREX-1 system adenine-specific DNA-methyltransferase PglX [Vibrio diabolicus]|uniref:BREX-1 system adenine-specific DNA-methyltransferase PglX n=1 Tax=Vibrio diabolicus TaxID=50719 RepID=UPI0037506882
MNTNKLKAYAPKARLAFMDAVKKRAAVLGIYENKISEATTQGTDTLIEGRIFTRKQGQQRQQLVKRIEALGGGKDGYNQFINEMAFTWFNRFTAIRFMEVNGYLDHGFRMLSKEKGAEFGQGFEILAHAADVAEDLGLNKADIVEMLLAGDKEEELYRELLLAQCHQLSKIMPFMFEKLDDATELLLPDNLTKTDSILKELVNDVPEDNWREIEVIGWLYQFYISEHKDAVIGKVVKKEDIPAATQLFTPNWIVKYLVQNSLGRQWLATYPDSELKDKMEYYITAAEQTDEVIEQLKAITPTSIDPEQIKVLDPACGSGHILVEVYEVLREIYLERGYRLREIPELILTKNIYGLDIDDRAAQMAAFAVLMKAREDDRRIFSRMEDSDIRPNIYSIQSTKHISLDYIWDELDLENQHSTGETHDLFSSSHNTSTQQTMNPHFKTIKYLLSVFERAKTFGSLINVDSSELVNLENLRTVLLTTLEGNSSTKAEAARTILPIVEQGIILSSRFDVTIANPPYMGRKGMYAPLKPFLKENYPESIWDVYAAFIEKCIQLTQKNGYTSLITMQSWMSLPAFEGLRNNIFNTCYIDNMIHLGARAFDSISGEIVRTTAFSLRREKLDSYRGVFLDLKEGGSEGEKKILFHSDDIRYSHSTITDFKRLPEQPICYWIESDVLNTFNTNSFIGDYARSQSLNLTGDNERFLRRPWEVDRAEIGIGKNWLQYAKGGKLRKWFGNIDYVVAWDEATIAYYKQNRTARLISEEHWYKEGITWSLVTSGKPGFRLLPKDAMFDVGGASIIFDQGDIPKLLVLLNSPVAEKLIRLFNESKIQLGNVTSLPFREIQFDLADVQELIAIHKNDWNQYETSIHYTSSPLITKDKNISKAYKSWLQSNLESVQRVRFLETKLNDLAISAYKLDSVIDNTIPETEITLNGNQHYRFSTLEAQDDRLQSEAISDLLSFSIGCMMGRYSLDREGLVYAHAGNQGFKELVAEGAYNTFPADDDGIIPLAAEEWLFEDDATSRFRDFVKTVWGEEHLQENLDFVAESLCLDAIKPKKNESSMETIRRYFSTQFYKDHLKTYKKRPIYWLFSSGKEKAFECLVYLHRYNESTLARMRTEYVTPLMGKLETQHSVLTESSTNASSTEQRRIDKELKSIEKKQSELRAFDEELKHLAEMKISIDLDDGVKVNYGKFGNLLADVKAIHGKKPEELK